MPGLDVVPDVTVSSGRHFSQGDSYVRFVTVEEIEFLIR